MALMTCCSNALFFSSRRRHARLVSDWSSDVCSSDLSAAVDAANFAALGYRDRFTIRWPNCPFWEPLEFFIRNDGTWIRTDIAPTQPDIDPQFFELAASPWLPTAVNADART